MQFYIKMPFLRTDYRAHNDTKERREMVFSSREDYNSNTYNMLMDSNILPSVEVQTAPPTTLNITAERSNSSILYHFWVGAYMKSGT